MSVLAKISRSSFFYSNGGNKPVASSQFFADSSRWCRKETYKVMRRSVIDISHWEDPIDFKKVFAAGIVAMIAKATHCATGVDPAYAKFKRAAAPYKFLWGKRNRREAKRHEKENASSNRGTNYICYRWHCTC